MKTPERLEALLMIMTLSSMVYSAIEYKIRQEFQARRVAFVDQRKRPMRKPTAKWVFSCFLGFHVVYIPGSYRVVNRTPRRKKHSIFQGARRVLARSTTVRGSAKGGGDVFPRNRKTWCCKA